MEYDEIDQFVDQQHRQPSPVAQDQVLSGEVLRGDPRLDEWTDERIAWLVQQVYDEALRRQNFRIDDGRRNANDLPRRSSVPPVEQSSNVHSFQGLVSDPIEPRQDGSSGIWLPYGGQSVYYEEVPSNSLTCLEWVMVGLVVVGLLLYLMITS